MSQFDDFGVMAMKDRGKWISYTGRECVNCGRLRVDLWENGDKICEKCNMNQVTKKFEDDYREFI